MACLGIDDKAAFGRTAQRLFLNQRSEGAFTLEEWSILEQTGHRLNTRIVSLV